MTEAQALEIERIFRARKRMAEEDRNRPERKKSDYERFMERERKMDNIFRCPDFNRYERGYRDYA